MCPELERLERGKPRFLLLSLSCVSLAVAVVCCLLMLFWFGYKELGMGGKGRDLLSEMGVDRHICFCRSPMLGKMPWRVRISSASISVSMGDFSSCC